MSMTPAPKPLDLVLRGLIYAVASLIVILFVLWKAGGSNPHFLDRMAGPLRHARPHWPDMVMLSQQPPVILFHIGVAAAALMLGIIQLAAPRGTLPHRLIGWVWLMIMASIAISGFFIQSAGHFSLIHIFSVVTLILIPLIIWRARCGDIAGHANIVLGLFIGALLVSGVLAFMPGRLMWNVFFG